MPEMYELRLLTYMKKVLGTYTERVVELPVEEHPLHGFDDALKDYGDGSAKGADYAWDTIAQARDDYRNATSVYSSGEVVSHSASTC